jgi:hypothetical protein
MKHFQLVVLVGWVTVFFIAGIAFAQGGGGCDVPMMGCPQLFAAMDTNEDGRVSKDEFLAAPPEWDSTEQRFQTMDVNGHGYLTKDELCSSKGMRMGK